MNTRYYQKYIEKLINSNPITITATRKIATEDGYGGKTEEVITLEPQTVTFYNKKVQREVITDKGVTMSGVVPDAVKMLCRGDIDLKEGDNISCEGKSFRVAIIKEYGGICKQAELEVVG